jgi:hypothetical protein
MHSNKYIHVRNFHSLSPIKYQCRSRIISDMTLFLFKLTTKALKHKSSKFCVNTRKLKKFDFVSHWTLWRATMCTFYKPWEKGALGGCERDRLWFLTDLAAAEVETGPKLLVWDGHLVFQYQPLCLNVLHDFHPWVWLWDHWGLQGFPYLLTSITQEFIAQLIIILEHAAKSPNLFFIT